MATMSVINIFTDYIFGIYGRIILFIAVTTLCYFLYKSVTNGIKQTAQLTTLNSTLAEKVAEQTAEIRKAYELEKHARRDLEKLNETKDQFIMITQHHLRAPVTRIKNDLAATLSGDNGRLSAKLTRSLEDTDATATRLSKIVDDFLDITTLKVGSQILNIGTGNLGLLTEDVLDELRIDIEKMHLTVENGKPNIWPDLQIDAHKMREVLLIILENAIKYNVDGGTIEVTTDSRDGYFEIVVKNTGIGLTSLDREKLFKKNYYRSAAAMTVNPRGMGIGLSVARAIVRAHKGELTIGSEGLHKGVKVVVGVAV
ncbi:MAG: HAMP domain-containing sensor histidine kinase [Candidatus Taylorbacteria bacterium]